MGPIEPFAWMVRLGLVGDSWECSGCGKKKNFPKHSRVPEMSDKDHDKSEKDKSQRTTVDIREI